MKTKVCANPICGEKFENKNPKKRFCCLHCKNQAAYNYVQKNYSWEVLMQKGRRKNIQILEYLFNKKDTNVIYAELKKVGFDFYAGFVPLQDENNFTVYRYGNIGMRVKSKTEFELFLIKA